MIELSVPEPDFDGFEQYIEQEYSSDRCSKIQCKPDAKSGGRIYIASGEYPTRSRFIMDLRPKLHEYGFVISDIKENHPKADGNHIINAVPMLWVVALANGYVCNRGACRNIAVEACCEQCEGYTDQFKDSNPLTNPDHIDMIYP